MVVFFLLPFAFSLFSVPLWAQENAVEAGAEALRGGRKYPWYDRQNDQLRRIDVESPIAPPRPKEWLPSTKKKFNWTWNWGNWYAILKWIVWIVLAALFVLLIVLAIRTFLRREVVRDSLRTGETLSGDSDVDRVEKLPFRVKRPLSDLLGEARRNYELGNYSEAIIYLFSYQLVEMDKSQIIRLAKGKTNRQYLGETRRRPALRSILERTMLTFEEVFFGAHPIDRWRFEQCWNQLDYFRQLVQQAPA